MPTNVQLQKQATKVENEQKKLRPMSSRLAEVQSSLLKHSARVAVIRERAEKMEHSLSDVEGRQTDLERHVAQLDAGLIAVQQTMGALHERLVRQEQQFETLLRIFGPVEELEEPEPETGTGFTFTQAVDDDVYRVSVSGPVEATSRVELRRGADTKLMLRTAAVVGERLEAQLPLAELQDGSWDVTLVDEGGTKHRLTTLVLDKESVPPELLAATASAERRSPPTVPLPGRPWRSTRP